MNSLKLFVVKGLGPSPQGDGLGWGDAGWQRDS